MCKSKNPPQSGLLVGIQDVLPKVLQGHILGQMRPTWLPRATFGDSFRMQR